MQWSILPDRQDALDPGESTQGRRRIEFRVGFKRLQDPRIAPNPRIGSMEKRPRLDHRNGGKKYPFQESRQLQPKSDRSIVETSHQAVVFFPTFAARRFDRRNKAIIQLGKKFLAGPAQLGLIMERKLYMDHDPTIIDHLEGKIKVDQCVA